MWASGHNGHIRRVMSSRRLMLNLPLQSRFIARSACHTAPGESYGRLLVAGMVRQAPSWSRSLPDFGQLQEIGR
jgi:hypothetical protein